MLGRYPLALVRDRDHHRPALVTGLHPHCHHSALGAVADGIVNQIAKYLRQSLGVTEDSEWFCGRGLPDLYASDLRAVGRRECRRVNERRCVHPFEPHARLSALGASHRCEVL